MKKLIFALIGMLGMLAASCTSEAPLQSDEPLVPEKSAIRTEADAIEIAKDLASTRHSSRADVAVANVEVIGSNSRAAATDTLIYVVNYANESGFAMVSAAKTGEQVIGFSDNGTYCPEEAEENPNFCYYMNIAKSYVADNLSNISIPVGPLDPIHNPDGPGLTMIKWAGSPLSVQWGQRYPEGQFCPNGISGCVQTAMAQIMTYLESPTSISLTYPEKDKDSQDLNWSEIKKHKKSGHLGACEASIDTHKAIGRLCRQLGELNHAIYDGNGTGAYLSDAWMTMKNLWTSAHVSEIYGFSDDAMFGSTTKLYELMSQTNGVAYVRGQGPDGGHAWVCDEAEEHITTHTATKSDGTVETWTESIIYYHYNWGWNGSCNGFFNAGVFTVKLNGQEIKLNENPMFIYIYK